MPSGQSFQERNASFEHMYSPSRAKILFKRHKEIHDIAATMQTRLAWEKKTMKQELQKNITMFQRRGDILYQKLKEVEDRYFAEFGRLEELEEEGEEEDDQESYRPSTHLGVYDSHRRISLEQRPMTSHPTLITTPKQSCIKERPGSAVGNYQVRSRPPSAAGSLPRSRNASRPSSGLTHRATTVSGVRFAVDDKNNKEPEEEADNYNGLKPLPVERPPGMSAQSSRFLKQRARRKSVFALTKAKQYELRNEGFKEDIMILQEELKDKMDDFLQRIDKFKEDYKKAQDHKREHPKVSGGSVSSTEEIIGHNKMSNKFKIKLVNPYANAKSYSLTTPNPELYCKSSESMKSASSVRSVLHQRSDTSITDVLKPSIPERAVSHLSNTSIGSDAKHYNKHTITRTLSIASRVSTLSEGKSKEEMMKERVKLLYLDAHGQLEDEPETVQEIMKKTAKKPQRYQSDLVLDTHKMKEAFEEFIDGNQEPDDLKRLIAHTVKMKHRVRKRRDKSIVPFMAARRAVKLWKSAANIGKAKVAETAAET